MLVRDILKAKTTPRLITVSATASLQKASEQLARQNVGMLLVTADDGRLLGILSERDVVGYASRHGLYSLAHEVRQAMADVSFVASPLSPVSDMMKIMTVQRARHLPVFDGTELVGVISIGDILHSRLAEKDLEATVLRDLARTSLALAA